TGTSVSIAHACSGSTMEHQVLDDAPADQMLVNDAVHVLGCHVVVPDAIGLHAQDRASFARGEAAHAAALHSHRALMQSGRLELVAQAVEQRLRLTVLRAARSGADEKA